jgi:Ran GTPase-activating protein (RanGAP) involved in mRNA processing and transport
MDQSVSLRGTYFDAEAARVLSEKLERKKNMWATGTVTSLDVANTWLSDDGAAKLATLLEGSAVLMLDLALNEVTSRGARALGAALSHPECPLTSLNISCNHIGDEGARAVASALAANKTLTRLSVRDCGLTATGASALAVYLAGNPPLTALDVGYNCLRQEGAAFFARALRRNSNLTALNLERCDLPHGDVTLFEGLDCNRTLCEVPGFYHPLLNRN